jgi:gliding motility-associated-like protein
MKRNNIQLLLFFILLAFGLKAQTFNSTGSTNIPDGTGIIFAGSGGEACNSISVSGLSGNLGTTTQLSSVCINVAHGYVGDLSLTLVSPNGTRYLLSDQNGGSGANYTNTCFTLSASTAITAGTAPFSGNYIPEFGGIGGINNGQSGNGTWQLCGEDFFSGDAGTISSWTITFQAIIPPANFVFPCFNTSINAGADQTVCAGATCTNVNLAAVSPYVNKLTTSYVIEEIQAPNPALGMTGTNIIVDQDDVWSAIVPLGFSFCFFGNTYNNIVIGANGLISFNTAYANNNCPWNTTGITIPTNTYPINSIMSPYTDIDPSVGFSASRINYRLEGVSPCRRMVISFNQVPNFSGSCNSQLVSSQIILYEAFNIIDCIVYNRPVCTSWNDGEAYIGIQNAAGNIGYSPTGYNPSNSTFNNKAYRFVPDGAAITPTITWTNLNTNTVISNANSATACVNTTTDFEFLSRETLCSGSTVIVRDTVRVNVNQAPIAVAGNDVNTCPDNNFTIGTGSAAGVTYTWTSVPASPVGVSLSNSNISNPVVTVLPTASPQTITYTVRAEDAIGCFTTDEVTVTIGNITVNAGPDVPVCSGSSVSIGSANVPGFTYAWTPLQANLPAGVTIANPNTAQPTISVAAGTAPQSITFTVTANQGSCVDTDEMILTIGNLTVDAGNDINICGGLSATIGAANIPGTIYTWTPLQANLPAGVTITNANTAQPTISVASGTPSQTITFTVNASQGVCNDTDEVTVTIGNVTANITSLPNTNCNNTSTCNGSATINPTSGVSPYTYLWSNGATTRTNSGLCGGNYCVTVSDNVGCTTSACVDVTHTPPTIVPSFSPIADICLNAAAPSLPTTSLNGITGTWNPAIVSSSSLGATTYTFTPDAGQCATTATLDVNVIQCCAPYIVTPTINNNSSACSPCNGNISLNVVSTNPNIRYNWSNGGITNTISALCPGQYSVTISCDFADCDTVLTYDITGVPQLTVTGVVTNEGCDNQPGNIITTTNNGLPPYTYAWTPANGNNPDFNPANAGNYSLTVTDANGCTATNVFEVNPFEQFIPVIDARNVVCGVPGKIDVTLRNGNAPFTFAWSSNAPAATNTPSSTNISNLSAGTYTLTITDNTNCISIFDVIVDETIKPIVNITGNPQQACIGENITLNAMGADTYVWSTGETTTTITVPVTGSQTISLVGTIGSCISEPDTFRIEAFPVPNVVISGNTTVCGSGSTTLTATPGYVTYEWRDNMNVLVGFNNVFTATSSGVYTVTVSGGGGCTSTAAVTVSVTPRPIAAIVPGPTINQCVGSTLSLCGSGATNFIWSTGETTACINRTITGSESITLVTFEDISCPSLPSAVQVVPYSTPDVRIVEGLVVNVCGSSTTLNAQSAGANTYQWFDSNGIINGATSSVLNISTSGTYTVEVTNSNGCKASETSTVTLTPRPVATITPDGALSQCIGNNIELCGTGATNFIWSTGETTACINRTITGSESITLVTFDDISCPSLPSAVQVVPYSTPDVRIVEGLVVNVCGSSTTLNAQSAGANTYQWFDSNGIINGATSSVLNISTSGTYTVEVTNSNGCKASEISTVTLTPRPVATITPDGALSQCIGNNIELCGTGASNYLWSTGEGTQCINRIFAGIESISLIVYDDISCPSLPVQMVIRGNRPPQVSILQGRDVHICGDSVNLNTQVNGVGPFAFQWADGNGPILGANAGTFTAFASGNYSVEVTDNNGCKSQINSFVELTPRPVASISPSPLIQGCVGTDVLISGFGSINYLWSTGETTSTIHRIITGGEVITLEVFDDPTCKSDPATVVIKPFPTPLLTVLPGSQVELCASNFDIRVSESNSGYSWFDSNNNLIGSNQVQTINAPGGTYYVEVMNAEGCKAKDTVSVILHQPNFNVDLSSANQTICDANSTRGGSVEISVNPIGNYRYEWSNGSHSNTGLTDVSAGFYRVTVVDENRCYQIDSIELLPPPVVQGNVQVTNEICYGDNNGAIVVNVTSGTSPFNFTWGHSATEINDTILNLPSGGYYVTVTDSRNCILQLDANVLEGNLITVDAGDTITMRNGQPVVLTAITNALDSTIVWNTVPAQNTQSIIVSPTRTTTYNVVVTDGRGCFANDDVTVVVPSDVFAVPNAFTPGIAPNDVFFIKDNGTITVNKFMVFNRWGEMIYNNPSPWNGTYKSQLQPVGTYVYVFEITKSNGEKATVKGDFSIIK